MTVNKVGLADMFNNNIQAIKEFIQWVKTNDEFCEHDIEYIKFAR